MWALQLQPNSTISRSITGGQRHGMHAQSEAVRLLATDEPRRSPGKRRTANRVAFTLLELLLSLSLIVVATALIGGIMQIYAGNFATRGDDIRRMQLARSILNMIAEDIRGVVLKQEYDSSTLEQMMGVEGMAGGSGDAAVAADDTSGLASDSADSNGEDSLGDLSQSSTANLPLGLYGSQFQLMVDVSRVPRADEYQVQQDSIWEGSLADVPGDLKRVTYFVQSATNQGVDDDMNSFATASSENQGYSSGLVRRELDRAVTAYAEQMGNLQSLLRTGDIVAPEVISLEFAFFDGSQWLYEWDSSVQSLPWLVQITLAMQSARGEQAGKLQAGSSISTMSAADRQAYGIEVYELMVAIPGAQLQASDAVSADTAAGMESLGL